MRADPRTHRLLVIVVGMLGVMQAAGETVAPPLPVFVSIAPQKYLVEGVGGQHVRVQVMLAPGAAPESFEPSPRQVAELEQARIYFRIGMPFESAWLEHRATSMGGLEVVACCGQSATGKEDDAGRTDPHVWTDPRRAMRMAELMRDTLTDVDPAHASAYLANYKALHARLQALDDRIHVLLARPRTRYFIISHGSLGPLADACGLIQLPLEYGGRGAGPRQLADFVGIARRENIRTVLIQRQFNSAAARALAGELDAVAVEVDPLAEDYPRAMLRIAETLAEATR